MGLFLAAAFALLGSPGPGIAALLAVGRACGWSGGLRFYAGLQIGLAMAVALCGAGLVSLLGTYPAVTRAVIIAATIYLAYLSYAIATRPIGKERPAESASFSPLAGLLLGVTNPKAYLAISALLASPLELGVGENADISFKAALCVGVILVVDIVWLWVGVAVGRTTLAPYAERIMNIAMGATILLAAAAGLPLGGIRTGAAPSAPVLTCPHHESHARLSGRGIAMNLSDRRLEDIRAWLCGESGEDPAVRPDEISAMANELKQLRLRTSSKSRSELASNRVVGH